MLLLSVTLSKPAVNVEEILGKPYEKIKIKVENSSKGFSYFAEMFTKTQVFHQHFSEEELNLFLKEHAGTTFKNCVKRTETQEITILASKKGKITTLTKNLQNNSDKRDRAILMNASLKKKKYLLQEGTPVPFLVLLGIMNSDGKVIASRYDKFRQINRYLEFIDDTVNSLTNGNCPSEPLNIVDFGCGKSYLTFAVHYYLTEIKHYPCRIEGLDLKKEVIDYCNELAAKLKLENLIFHTGNIADYSGKENPDIVITLHACDTATDYALKYAVQRQSRAILSVPCCQHEINTQLQKNKPSNEELSPLLKWGILREKFSSLLTDALRGEWLETQGYKVQMLEFIDMEHTPKNILIRAINGQNKKASEEKEKPSILNALNITPEIWK
ncbi:MAG: SAM-dependent methyltransferase [Treponema sp.]|nr:SAM-dependent methyltransferase [Treponema sp.]